MNLQRLVRLWQPDPLATYRQLKLRLVQLENQITPIYMEVVYQKFDGVQMITPFFRAVSEFQDTDLVLTTISELERFNGRGQFKQLVADLDQLEKLITICGRNEVGWNRTRTGQPVTDHDVYLGDVGGYHTKNVAYIKANQADRKYYPRMCCQAEEFIRARGIQLIHAIKSLPTPQANTSKLIYQAKQSA